MEEQKITTITHARVTLKKSQTGKYGWDIASSEGENLKEIIEGIEEAHKIMLTKFKSKGVQ